MFDGGEETEQGSRRSEKWELSKDAEGGTEGCRSKWREKAEQGRMKGAVVTLLVEEEQR